MRGDQIKTLRESFDLTPVEMAELLGVQNSSIYRWESYGKKTAKIEGLPRRLIGLMAEMSAVQRTEVVRALRHAGWLSGLHCLVTVAYKKAA